MDNMNIYVDCYIAYIRFAPEVAQILANGQDLVNREPHDTRNECFRAPIPPGKSFTNYLDHNRGLHRCENQPAT